MKQGDIIGKVQTVLGLIDPDSLGVTLPHERLRSVMMKSR